MKNGCREIEHGSFSPLVFFSRRRYGQYRNSRIQEAVLSFGWETRKTLQLNTVLAKMQTELFLAEISYVHSGLTIYLPKLYIPTHGVHRPGPSRRPGVIILNPLNTYYSITLFIYNSLSLWIFILHFVPVHVHLHYFFLLLLLLQKKKKKYIYIYKQASTQD